jgi:hypothetical protein
MKKLTKRPLQLSAETLRVLDPRDLRAAASGLDGADRASTAEAFSCNGSCACQ